MKHVFVAGLVTGDFFQCFPQVCKYFFDISFYLFLQLRGCVLFFFITFSFAFYFISRYALKVSLSYGFPIQPYSPFTQCANTFLSHRIIQDLLKNFRSAKIKGP